MSTTATTPDLRYPVGKFSYEGPFGEDKRRELIQQVADVPARMRAAVAGLNDAQLNTPYRDGGWTVRQVVHHIVDSHMNSYIRFRWALTENEPAIKVYDEKTWAELSDAKSAPIELSLGLLEALHARWIVLLRALTPEDWKKTLQHPEAGLMTLDKLLGLYAWHGRHHVAHVTALRERMGW